jgi:sigma-B regulation protein RsbU (phosphoserine phosphatase)
LGRITHGELTRRVDERNVTEFYELSTGINATVSSLRETMDEVEQRNKQDLAAAKAIQESALPREFPPFPDIGHFDIYASMKTAKEVGGDFYDFFLVDDERLAFLIADVAGKGIPASLFMMAAKTQLRDYLEAGLPIEQAVDAANHQLCNGNDAGMFVTCWVGVLNYLTGELSYVNAGHNPPLLNGAGDADPSHDWRWVREVSGMPLGLFDGIPYDRHDCLLSPGDTLYLYTDGVTEAISAEKAFFGEERLVETLERYTGMNARSVSVGVRRAITDFTLDAEQSDDITMLSLRYGVPPEKRAIMVLSAETGQLIHVQNFIHEELHRRGAPKSAYGPIDIAAEELFVNTCRYAYPDAAPGDPGEVRIEFEYEASPPSLTVTISDDGVPFDPLTRAEMDAEMDAFDDGANALAGGMGIEMARRSVDDMRYERVDGCNVLTFRKGW